MHNRNPLRLFLVALLSGIFALFCAVYVAVLFVPLPLDRIRIYPVSPLVMDRYERPLAIRLSEASEYCIPISLDRMGRWLPIVVVGIEDHRFRTHPGVDPLALFRAIQQNIRAGSVVSGASTISSQLIRLSFPRPRTLRTKALEFLQALAMERKFDKDAILETYLNRAPFGGNIRGVQAAARAYFSKNAADLSLAETSLLVGMLKGPSIYRPDRNPRNALMRRKAVLDLLVLRGIVSPDDAKLAEREALPKDKGNIPDEAFHFVNMILRNSPGQTSFVSTLDPAVQQRMEHILSETIAEMPSSITAAGAVANNKTGEIVAYVGNARLGTGVPGNWVDCGQALRSPGSALKPFAYAAAFEHGLLSPSSILADTPLSFSGYAPRNFDLVYRGPVSARTALSDSLNAPAVRVLRLVGAEETLQRLRTCGFASLVRDTAHYGDSLILGGCDVTLLEMLEGYMTLATLGIRKTPALLRGNPAPASSPASQRRRVFSEGAAFLVADILRDTGRLLPIFREVFRHEERNIAFKTGTSYGLRDAWTAAYTPSWTAVVWVGDTAAASHPNLVGLHAAAPAALKIIRHLSQGRGDWYDPPDSVSRGEVCSVSGMPPSPLCPRTKTEWRITDVSPKTPCDMHVLRDGAPAVVWPSELEDFARRTSAAVRAKGANITSPLPDSICYLAPGDVSRRIAFTCEGGVRPFFWFVDGEFYGRQGGAGSLFWTMTPGKHRVAVTDSAGNSAASAFEVIRVGKIRERIRERETLSLD